jgi:4-amino-4-deoxy-L-arabinose transferase-like glycosyltransferase
MSTVHQVDAFRSRPFDVLARGVVALAPLVALAGIAALAAVLRFTDLGSMTLNPYYDAAVRSMGTSWHAFLVGAFNPNATVAVDKPPLDLWFQVAATKVFEFNAFALLLPEALASTAAVLLLYDLVRRGFGRTAGLAAAAALAVLPLEVMTGRSDTMDGVMMALLVLAAWLVVRAIEKERGLELYAAGAVVGLAFETKLFEALIALPALTLLFLIASRTRWPRRLAQIALAGGVMVVVGLAWTIAFALTQRNGVPYPMGSTNGLVWHTVFVYNGTGRLVSTSTRTAADALSPPGLTRLLSGGPVHLNLLVGEVLFAALAFGLVAVLLRLARGRARARGRLPLALAVAMGTWLLLGAGILSYMVHMPVRYLEPVMPAIAAVLGIGVAYTARAAVPAAASDARALLIVRYVAATLLMLCAVAASLVYARGVAKLPTAAYVGVAVAAILLVAGSLLVRMRLAGPLASALAALTTGFALVAVLAGPTSESFALERANTSDGGSLGAMPTNTIARLSSYLTRHGGRTRYEFAAYNAALAAPLIVADARPVMILAGTPYHQLVYPRGLARAARAGEVRYVLLSARPRSRPVHPFPPRSSRSQIPSWVVRHGTDVTRQAGINGYGMLYRVSAAPQTRIRHA